MARSMGYLSRCQFDFELGAFGQADWSQVATMDVYIFPSVSLKNIEIGVRHKTWAVARMDGPYEAMRLTRSRDMPIGAAGLFYCSADPKFFTVPFLVESRPEDRPVDGVWDERWFSPFSLRPIGDTRNQITLAHARNTWEKLKEVGNVTEAINLGPAMAFAKTWFPRHDWDLILEQLHINPEDFEELFP
jgi:hypothetical protein